MIYRTKLCITWLLLIFVNTCTSMPYYKYDSIPGEAALSSQNKTSNLIINGVPSQRRLFYARLRFMGSVAFCGATVIEEKFLMTAAHCVYDSTAEEIFVEIGDFALAHAPKTKYKIAEIFIAPGFEPSLMPRNDLAILQTATPIIAFEQVYLQVCPEEIPEESLPMTLFGSCGMGKPETLGNSPKIATPELMETAFRSVPYHHYEGSDYIPCRIDNICTAPAIQDAAVCTFDYGGPLYKFDTCGEDFVPECVYGIASYSASKTQTPHRICNDGSYFVRLSFFYGWIGRIFLQNN
ncbi:myeloblastin-like [Convolutriloba macropyga]|uniref:myeloblastin-like n=1 Tax=Convolutriloba macropyga TaxID=536237 RepID=UPI003F5235F5